MDTDVVILRRVGRFGALYLLVTCAAAVGQQSPRELTLAADSMSVDLQSGSSVYKGLLLSDGTVSIEAAEGTSAVSAKSGQWRLRGGVKITFDGAVVSADNADFQFSAGRITAGEVLGNPVTFTGSAADDADVQGTADRIVYDGLTGMLSASGNTSFVWEGQTVDNCDWIYRLNEKMASWVSDSDGKCVMRIAVQREP